MSELQTGDRVQVMSSHRYNPGCKGVITLVESRLGNRFIVALDYDPGNTWHDEQGRPSLRLGQTDLVLLAEEDENVRMVRHDYGVYV